MFSWTPRNLLRKFGERIVKLLSIYIGYLPIKIMRHSITHIIKSLYAWQMSRVKGAQTNSNLGLYQKIHSCESNKSISWHRQLEYLDYYMVNVKVRAHRALQRIISA